VKYISLVLPKKKPPEWQITQRCRGLKLRFGTDARVQLIALKDSVLPDQLEGDRFELVRYTGDLSAHVVIFEEASDMAAEVKATYRVSSIGRVIPVAGTALTSAELPELNRHTFSELAPSGWGDVDYYCFHYFPYGYLFRLVGLGPTDAFGHRISDDFKKYAKRFRNGKRLIVCLGGSAVWGTATLFEDCFPSQLEKILNKRLEAEHEECVVLNFGIPGAVMLNVIQRYMMFVADLEPDVIVLHDGTNDFFYGATSDVWLTSEHSIVYQQNFEHWAKFLHGQSTDQQNVHAGGPTGDVKDVVPIDILRSWLRRKRECIKMCKAFGARVVSGLQPIATSKLSLSSLEKDRIDRRYGTPNIYRTEFENIYGLYELFSREKPKLGDDASVNFHEEFGKFGADRTLFNDLVHMDADGEQIIAELYADKILPLLGIGGVDEQQ
jgi:lysophospholipase L1-like esterase